MHTLDRKKPWRCKLLIFLHLFLGLGAIGGGLVFIIDPSGTLAQLPASQLKRGPFDDYLIPGIILFVILGILPLMIAYGLTTGKSWRWAEPLNLYRNMHWSWTFSLYIGFALIIWVTVEAFIVGTVEWLHLIYLAVGLKIQAVTLLPSVQAFYSKKQSVYRKNAAMLGLHCKTCNRNTVFLLISAYHCILYNQITFIYPKRPLGAGSIVQCAAA